MAKKAIRTVAEAMSCANKVSNGQACTQAEMKSTIRILNGALKTARVTARVAKREALEAKDMLRSVLARVGL